MRLFDFFLLAVFGLLNRTSLSLVRDIYARSEYHTQLAKMSFDKIFDLIAGAFFYFYNICKYLVPCVPRSVMRMTGGVLTCGEIIN